MWFYPSYGRAQRAAVVMESTRAFGAESDGILLVSEDDPQISAYRELNMPRGWALHVSPAGHGWMGDKLNAAFKAHPNECWYGWIADDHVIKTDFEGQLRGAAGRFGIASANDLVKSNEDTNRSRMHGVAVFGGDLLRSIGFWAPEGVRHLYFDDVWELIGRTLGVWRVLMGVVTQHAHPIYGTAPMDETYRRGNSPERCAEDKASFIRWCETQSVQDILRASNAIDADRAKVLQRAKERSLLICVFCYDKPAPETMDSLAETRALLTRCGISHKVRRSQGMSLLPIARNYSGKFLDESGFTDLLLIDDDMQWSAWDVIKLLASPQDVIAGVGKRKDVRRDSDVNSWCFSLPDSFESDGELTVDQYGAIEVSRVGTAFLRIRRNVFETIAEKRPDLWRKHVTSQGEACGGYSKAFAITDIGGVEAGEDYSFCNLWRDLGGSVWIDPTIRLVHWGRQGFSGEVAGLFDMSPEEFARQGT